MLYNFLNGVTATQLCDILDISLFEMTNLIYDLESPEVFQDYLGYYVVDKDNKSYRLGLFLTHYGKTYFRSPALHIDFCEVAIKMKERLKYTNTQIVTYYSINGLEKFENQKLSVCKNCMKLVQAKVSTRITGNNFYDFILSIEEDDKLKEKKSDERGYSINWQQISKAYRESKNYTCENCSIQLDDHKNTKFWETHHINGYDKMNNRRSNLMCLCVKCHSEVDDYHRRQFSEPDRILLLKQFELYKIGRKLS